MGANDRTGGGYWEMEATQHVPTLDDSRTHRELKGPNQVIGPGAVAFGSGSGAVNRLSLQDELHARACDLLDEAEALGRLVAVAQACNGPREEAAMRRALGYSVPHSPRY